MAGLRETHQALTRERLLDAAARLFGEHGLDRTSLSDIAEGAGATTGAVYSNFDGKEDLFLSVVERHMERQLTEYQELFAEGENQEERLKGGADRWMQMVSAEPAYFPLFLEAWRFSRGNEVARQRLVESCRKLIDAIRAMVHEGGRPRGVSDELAASFALIVFALGNGLALQKLIDPDHVPDPLFGDFLVATVQGIPTTGKLK